MIEETQAVPNLEDLKKMGKITTVGVVCQEGRTWVRIPP
jgi:hypothetical protein